MNTKRYIRFWLAVILVAAITSILNGQDTIPVTLYIEDTTDSPDIWYDVPNPDNDSLTGYYSNEYYEAIPGWIVDGEYLTLRFEPLEPKYKVVTFYEREWYTIEQSVYEISEPGQTTRIYSREIWFQK